MTLLETAAKVRRVPGSKAGAPGPFPSKPRVQTLAVLSLSIGGQERPERDLALAVRLRDYHGHAASDPDGDQYQEK